MTVQNSFDFFEKQLYAEVAVWEQAEGNKGQVYTRPEVVSFMLTIIGIQHGLDLENIRVLEPSCGEGDFVIAIVDRFISTKAKKPCVEELLGKLVATDLVGSSIEIAKLKVSKLLQQHNYSSEEVSLLLDDWFVQADFLLKNFDLTFTHIIGNPPYVRVESIPKVLLKEYRRRFVTMTDRADLYVPFFEKTLSLLAQGGKLSFICTDRWTKNTYGKSLRKLISDKYSLELFVDLYGVEAFESEVMTYPAITQIVNKDNNQTVLVKGTDFSNCEAEKIVQTLNGVATDIDIRKNIVNGHKPWIFESQEQVNLIKYLEDKFPLLEDVGCKVYIGAATGANKIYIVDKQEIDIEDSRLLPVITAHELKTGKIDWSGKYIVNTYDDSGVVDLSEYPKLESYLNGHKDSLSKRHVAKKNIGQWFKTIDRLYKDRAQSEKLLIPDISNETIVVYDEGKFHPNNSIYYICSDTWDLHALRVVLLSNVTKMLISAYSTKIAKGYLRFQAQHLRKIRIPVWDSVELQLQNKMISAGKNNKFDVFDVLTCEMYNLDLKEVIIGV